MLFGSVLHFIVFLCSKWEIGAVGIYRTVKKNDKLNEERFQQKVEMLRMRGVKKHES